MLKHRLWPVAATLSAALGIAGCQYLGPRMTQQLDLPRNLELEKVEHEARETKPEGIKGTVTLKEPEFYPASGPVVGTVQGRERPPGKEGRYTLNFDDADVAEVAKAVLGDILKVNYVISPKVTGKVSLQTARPLAEDELIPTLEMILRANGAVLINNKGLFRIEPDATAVVEAPGASLGLPGQGLPAGYQLRVIPLRFVSVQDMQKVIEPLMPPKSIIRADSVRNLLLVAGSSEELEGVMDAVRLFDVDFMRGMSVGLFPLKNVDSATVAEELTKLFVADGSGAPGGAGGGALGGMLRLLPIERLNAILAVSPQPRYLSDVESWVERLDRYNTAKAGGVHVYRVENVDAVELAQTLSNIFGQGGGAGLGRPSVAPGFGGTQIGGVGVGSTGGAFGRSSSSGGFGGGTGAGLSSSGTGTSGFGSSSSAGSMGSSTGTSGGFGSGASGGFGGGTSSLGGGTGGGFGSGTSGSFGGGGAGSLGASAFGTSSAASRQPGGAGAGDFGTMRIVPDISSNSLIIVAKAQEWKQIEEVLKELDQMPRQVMIDATIAEIGLTGALQYGLQWFIRSNPSYAALGGGQNLAESLSTALFPASGFAYIFSSNQVKVILKALASEGKVNVLSSPSLMVLNNQQAQIKVGDQVPIQVANLTPVTGGVITQQQQIQYRDTGVILTIRPRVNSGGLVILDVEQAVDEPTKTTSSSIDSPTILQRQIKSTVAVKDRETIALGGLIRDRRAQTVSGLPWLYQVPIIGPLFGQTDREMARTELVVLLTPRVVDRQSDSRRITNEFRRSLKGLYKNSGAYGRSAAPAAPETTYP